MAQTQVLYASDVVLDQTGTIDAATGTWSAIGNQGIPAGESINGIAYDDAGGVLYGINTSTNALVTLDQATGAATVVGFTSGGQFNGLAYAPGAATLYSVTTGDALYAIDPASGMSAFIGSATVPDQVEGLAFDPLAAQLYGLNGQGQVYRIDTATGAMTPLPNLIGVSGNWRGLAWDDTGQRLLATLVGGGTGGQLWEVNPFTGSGTLIAATTDFAQGLAMTAGPPPPPFVYTVTPLVAGSPATFGVTGATGGDDVYFLYSTTGAGPTQTIVGPLDLSPPILVLAAIPADASGAASLTVTVPPGAGGRTLFTQAVTLSPDRTSNSLILPVQ